jgi:hypothetical protein
MVRGWVTRADGGADRQSLPGLTGPAPPAASREARAATAGIAVGNENNWLFAGGLRGGKRSAAAMSLVHSARMNGRDPYA